MYDTVYVTTLSDAPALPSSRHNRAFIIAPMQQLIGESKCRRQATPVTIREATNFDTLAKISPEYSFHKFSAIKVVEFNYVLLIIKKIKKK